MGLKEKLPRILKHIDNYQDFSEFNLRLYRVVEGQIKFEVERSLATEIISWPAYQRAKQRIPPINVIRKVTDKLSKVYTEAPKRMTDNKKDQEIMENIARAGDLNNVMKDVNRVYNAHNMAFIEPFIENGMHRFRVLGPHQMIPFSDDAKNPTKPTVLIKYLGQFLNRDISEFSNTGDLVDKKQIREVQLFALFSDEEWMVVDNSGGIRYDVMEMMGIESTVNPFGRIPYIYVNKSSMQLIPFPNQQGMDISILIPKLLTDLNYAAQFMSHSIIWSKNTDLAGQELNPDAVIDLGDGGREEGEPEIGVISPEVDIPNLLGMIEFELKMYLSTVGIKADSGGTMSNGRDSSALAKAIDEGDTTSVRKDQIDVFRRVEHELWSLMNTIQSVWASSNAVEENRTFSSTFVETFRIHFAEMRPVKTQRQKIEEIQLMRDLKMITRRQSIKMLMPELTDKQVETWITELDDEAVEAMEKMMDMGVNIGPERQADGTFNEGNTAAGNQDETSKDETDLDERTN